MEEVNVNLKVREIISFYKLSDNAFAKRIGVTQSVIGSMFQKGTEPSAKVTKQILKAFPDISAEWLLRDAGNMLLSSINDDSNERLSSLVDTIATLTSVVKSKEARIKELEEEITKLKKK